MSAPVSDRPNPLMRVAALVGPATAALSAMVVFLAGSGILTAEQADAVDQFGQAVNTTAPTVASVVSALIAAGGVLVGTFAHAKLAKGSVTPVEAPRDNQGRPLTPDVIA